MYRKVVGMLAVLLGSAGMWSTWSFAQPPGPPALAVRAVPPVVPPSPPPQAERWRLLVDLRGAWRFSIGDNAAWARASFDDRDWQEVFAPSKWEDEGYAGYDGFAWYRKRFELPRPAAQKPIYLQLGRVDDVDVVYVNGHFVGATGNLGKEYRTGFHTKRVYRIPDTFLNREGQNVIAVRVFDQRLEGGLVEGPLGLYELLDVPDYVVDLEGVWQFYPGDLPLREAYASSRDRWHDVTVPARWEQQGFEDYDGFAWYRKAFKAPRQLERELMLVLGKIDDLDEVFLNERRIGSTGDIASRRIRGDEWQEVRVYPIPDGLLRGGEENVLAVRVYDGLIDGGIFEGPVAIMTRRELEKQIRTSPSFLDLLKSWFWER